MRYLMKKPRTVRMKKKAFVSEHTHLIRILKSGSKAAQRREAKEQSKELSKYI